MNESIDRHMHDDEEPKDVRTIAVYQDTISRPMQCRGRTCTAELVWAETVNGHRRMCFTHPTEPVSVTESPGSRQIAYMPFDRNHWATCPDAKVFQRRR
jgi:hypothetical protein